MKIKGSKLTKLVKSKNGILKKDLKDNSDNEVKDYTILYYYAGNNNIADDMIIKTRRLEKYGSNKNVNALVEMAQPENSKYPNITRFYIIKDKNYKEKDYKSKDDGVIYKNKKIKRNLPDLKSIKLDNFKADSADPKTLTDAIVWAMKNYPSKHFVLNLMDHGFGFLGSLIDDTSQNMMRIPDIQKALKDAEKITGKKIDILIYDSCLMQQAEVLYQLKDTAKIMIASEEVEFPYGMPEAEILKTLHDISKTKQKDNIKITSKILTNTISKDEVVKTVSAVNLSKMENLVKDLDNFAKIVLTNKNEKDKIKKAISESFYFCKADENDKLCTNYRDIKEFMTHILKLNISKEFNKSAKQIIKDIDNMVINNKYDNLAEKVLIGGLSIYLPSDGILDNYTRGRGGNKILENPKEVYKKLSFSENSKWDEMLEFLK